MQALSERVGDAIAGRTFNSYRLFGFSGLKTALPAPESLTGQVVEHVGRRGKYLTFDFPDGTRMLMHLSQGGRLDIESPAKDTKPKGSIVRLIFGNDHALLLREFGTERKAGWWIVAPDEEGPLGDLGPEPDSDEFANLIRTGTDGRQIHSLLRDQHTVAGIGRGYADDILHRAKLSPFASLKSMSSEYREALLTSVDEVLTGALEKERTRKGGLSESKLGEHFTVHNHSGEPCPVCGDTMQRVSFESHEITYCPTCQTGGKILADRRLSRLLK